MEYETIIGLEVHVQLKTRTKAFCGCVTEFGQAPNSQTCPVCLGLPGSLPVLNKIALDYTIKAGLALNCKIQEFSKFDRKHYYYPDLPKNFQISQYDLPVCKDGFLDIIFAAGPKRVGIKRLHLEEDAGKLIHREGNSLVDYNRTGIALLEIVSEPEINSPEEAYEYLTALKTILRYIEISDCDMEKGSLRCDANISLRPKGEAELGTKTELKNMNSFKAVKEALAFEAARHRELLERGTRLIQETRLWDAQGLRTCPMRSKEEAKDYRYFPEPDLPPFILNSEKIEELKKNLPELPREKIRRLQEEFSLSEYDAKVIAADKKDALFCEACLKAYADKDKKPLVNWLIGPMLAEANSRNCLLSQLNISPPEVIALLGFIQREEISHLSAKAVLTEMLDTGKNAAQLIKEKNLLQVSDSAGLKGHIEEVIRENPATVEAIKKGKDSAIMFLVGQVMKKTQGKANPKVVQQLLRERL